MSENSIATLARTLQHTDSLQQDLSQMFSALQNTIETNYLQKIRTAAQNEKTFSVEHPPREVTLLRALSAFTNEAGHQQIDRMTQSLLFLHSLQHIHQNVQQFSEGNLLATRSAEGHEDQPSLQSAQLAGLLLTLAIADQF